MTSTQNSSLRSRRLRAAAAAFTLVLASPTGLALAGAAQAQPSAGLVSTSVSTKTIPAPWVERNLAGTGWLRHRHVYGTLRAADRRAVMNFQNSRCLVTDGIVGPNTWGELQARVRNVQRKVDVTVDGHYGLATRRAVKRYRAQHHLTVDGIAGPRTMYRMGVNRHSRNCP